MSMIVAHMLKHNSGSSCSGMYSHNERLSDSKTNSYINKNKTHLNYELVNHNHILYNEVIKNKIKELGYGKNGKKQLRKDAVKMCSWIISSDNDFFKKLTEQEQKQFFEESLNFFKNEFGEENIISATVHNDETTPHMHLNIMPIIDKSFNCKKLFNKTKLKKIQDNLPKHLQSKGFYISRGKENSTNKHLNELEYKIKTKENYLKYLDEKINNIIKNYTNENSRNDFYFYLLNNTNIKKSNILKEFKLKNLNAININNQEYAIIKDNNDTYYFDYKKNQKPTKEVPNVIIKNLLKQLEKDNQENNQKYELEL